jgi:hypothetical protein
MQLTGVIPEPSTAQAPEELALPQGPAPKRKKKAQRTIRLVRPLTVDGVGVFSITVGEEVQFYTLVEMGCEIGGRGFAVHKTGLGTLYHVRVGGPEDCSCECMGFLRHGKCKHLQGLRELIRRGLL